MKSGFTLRKQSEIREIGAAASLYVHESGAEFYHIKTKDKNRAFCVSFKTYPGSNNGAAHILEHAVFSGSEKYPLKEPFVNMMKGSLNTFLNAITMADRTLYPVASANEKDLLNLIDVYLDSVFHPLIYTDPVIFMQEGWHFEFDEEGQPLVSGVVFNEQKGNMASPEAMLQKEIDEALFKGPYRYVSGGVPEDIMGMPHEAITDFHKEYYNPANCRFYLYGDIEPDEVFARIEEATRGIECREVEAAKTIVSSVPRYVTAEYPGMDGMDISGMTFCCGSSADTLKTMALTACFEALFQMDSSPVRRALIDGGTCLDLYSYVDNSKDVTLLNLVLIGAEVSLAEDVEKAVFDALGAAGESEILEMISASFSNFSFTVRENEFGDTPAGIAYCLQLLTGETAEDDPFGRLRYEKDLEEVGRLIESGEILDILRQETLENKSRVTVKLDASEELAYAADEEEAQKAEDLWNGLSEEEKEEAFSMLDRLIEKQEREDTPEELAMMPRLTAEDVQEEPEIRDVERETLRVSKAPELLHYETQPRDIIDLRVFLPVRDKGPENLFLLGTLSMLLGELPTREKSVFDLQNEILKKFGLFYVGLETIKKDAYFVCHIKTSKESFSKALALAGEILTETDFSDRGLIETNLRTREAGFIASLSEDAMDLAEEQAESMIGEEARMSALFSGVPYYKRLKEILASDEEGAGQIADASVRALGMQLAAASRPGVRIGLISDAEGKELVSEGLGEFFGALEKAAIEGGGTDGTDGTDEAKEAKELGALASGNAAYVIPSQVQYIAQAGKYGEESGIDFDGRFYILKTILESDYLWTNVRLKGGAYGSSFIIGRENYFAVTSHSDPGLAGTLEVFGKIPEYLRGLAGSDMDIFEPVLGSLNYFDRPLTEREAGEAAIDRALRGMTKDDILKERREMLDATLSDVSELAAAVEEGLAGGGIVVFGNAGSIEEEKELFDLIEEPAASC